MAKRVFWICVLILLVLGSVWFFKHHKEQTDAENGSFTCEGCMSATDYAKFKIENAGEDADGQKEHKSTSGSKSADDAKPAAASTAPAPSPITPVTTPAQAQPAPVAATTAKSTTPAPVQPAPVATPAPSYPTPSYQATPPSSYTSTSASAGPLPAGDSQSPNAPNGAIFTGSGAYQWYRQGNLTWRVDSRTGRSCIVFATDEEWRKERVLAHGCGKNA